MDHCETDKGTGLAYEKKITIYQERQQQQGTEDRIKKDSAVK